jgi:putative PEP-CTERM system histidine kinase
VNSSNLILTGWSYGLVGLAYSAFAWRLLQQGFLRAPFNLASVSVFLAVALSALWGWFGLGYLLRGDADAQFLSLLADVLRYGGWFGFLLALFRPQQTDRMPASMRFFAPLGALLVVCALAVQFMAQFQLDWLGDSARLVLLCSMALPVFGLVLLEQVYRNVQEDSRWNAKPLCLGLLGAFVFDLYLYSQAVLFNKGLDTDALGIRGTVHALMVPLLLLSIAGRRNWIAKVRVSRAAAFHSATLVIAGIYLVFISAVGYYVRIFGGEWGRALQLGVVFLALVFLLLLAVSGSMRARLRVFLGKHFFRYRYDYREEWLRFTHTLSSATGKPQEMGLQIVRGLADMLESPAGGLWMKMRDEPSFSQTARWNMAQATAQEAADSPLCRFMHSSGWVINLEEYRIYRRRYGTLELPDWLHELEQAWLILPLIAGEELIGFVVLARSRTPMDVNWEVNDLLKTAGRQAASYLAQMQATEKLLEVRKFDAFNRMSAFVVHDLKNIVTQLSLMMKNAKRLHDNPEFQQDMLMTVENSLDRMRQLMLQLREGATPPGTAVGVDLGAIVDRVAGVARGRGRTLEVTLVDKVMTRGHEERLERIVGHVVQNAFDATDPAGRVWLQLARASGWAKVEVGDTGQGMTQEFIRDRLFKPFQTTKQAGMGIGAYESFQYVQELGGKIEVQSEPGRGTTVTILLPLLEIQNESDIHISHAA